MACIDPLHPLYSDILEIVASSKSLSFDDLRRHLARAHGGLSNATLYRRLNELIEQQVLLRYKRRLSLNLVWVSHLLHFSETIRQNYAVASQLVPLPRREGEYRDYHAGSLANLDPIWNNIHIELGMRCNERVWFGYNSHPWYPLGMPDTEQRLQESFAANGYRYHLLYGGDSVLDRYGRQLFRIDGFQTATGRPACLDPHNYAVWAGHGYLLECVLPASVARSFANFFSRVKRPSAFNRSAFAKVFKSKTPCRLRVTKSRRQAQKMRALLEPYFPQKMTSL